MNPSRFAAFILLIAVLVGCNHSPNLIASSPSLHASKIAPVQPTDSSVTPASASLTPSNHPISTYAFPTTIDQSKRYLFYLHGKIIEDQGVPAVSLDFGEYEYLAILER